MTRPTLAPVCAQSGRRIARTEDAVRTIRARGTAVCPACGKPIVSRFTATHVYLSPHRGAPIG